MRFIPPFILSFVLINLYLLIGIPSSSPANNSISQVINVIEPLNYLKGEYAQDIYIKDFYLDSVKFWGGIPSHCITQGITITSPNEFPSVLIAVPTNLAWARLLGCEMALNTRNQAWPTSSNNFIIICNVITHELGHNFGYRHIEDINNIMYENIQLHNPHCNKWSDNSYSPQLETQNTNKEIINNIENNFDSDNPVESKYKPQDFKRKGKSRSLYYLEDFKALKSKKKEVIAINK